MVDKLAELLKWTPDIEVKNGDYCEVAKSLINSGVIVPPCKVGQTVYYIWFGKVYKGKCHAITIHKNSVQIHLYDCDGDNASVSAKLVFLTKEDAERELEKRARNEN